MSDVALNFDGPKGVDLNAIQAALDAEVGPAAAEPAPADNQHAAEAAPAENTPAAVAEPATEPPPPQEALKTHKITVNGQELEVTEADLKSGHMRHLDYTQKTQALAAERQALAAQIQQERQQWEQERAAVAAELSQLDQFLKDQNAVATYMQKAFGVSQLGPTPPPQIDPNKPLTAVEVAEIARYNAEQVRLQMQREVIEARQEALKAQQAVLGSKRMAERATAEAEIDLHLRGLLDKHPVLKKFEGIEEELMGEAARYMPGDRKGTVQDAKQRLSEAAERRMATIKAIAEDTQKAAAVEAAKLRKTSPEPVGGSVPKPAPGKKLTLNATDRKEFLAAAEADLRAFMAGQG